MHMTNQPNNPNSFTSALTIVASCVLLVVTVRWFFLEGSLESIVACIALASQFTSRILEYASNRTAASAHLRAWIVRIDRSAAVILFAVSIFLAGIYTRPMIPALQTPTPTPAPTLFGVETITGVDQYWIRANNCDDICRVYIGTQPNPLEVPYNGDSGWIPITQHLSNLRTVIRLEAVNSQPPAIAYRFQVRKNDTEILLTEECGIVNQWGCQNNREYPIGPLTVGEFIFQKPVTTTPATIATSSP